MTVLGVIVLLAAAAVALARPRRSFLWGVAVLAAAFTLLDLREALHQDAEARSSLVAAALALAFAHAAAALLSIVAARTRLTEAS